MKLYHRVESQPARQRRRGGKPGHKGVTGTSHKGVLVATPNLRKVHFKYHALHPVPSLLHQTDPVTPFWVSCSCSVPENAIQLLYGFLVREMMCVSVVPREDPKQDFPYTRYSTSTRGDAEPLLAFCLKRVKSRHTTATQQSWYKADHPEVWDSHCCSSGYPCAAYCRHRVPFAAVKARLLLLHSSRLCQLVSGVLEARYGRQQALNFSSELKNTEQSLADHRRMRAGGLVPSVASDQQEEVTGRQLRHQKTINAGKSGWERQSWEDNICHSVLHSWAVHWTSARFWAFWLACPDSVCSIHLQGAALPSPLSKRHLHKPLSGHNMCNLV